MFSRAILALFRSSFDIPSTVRTRSLCSSETHLCFRSICAFGTQCDHSPSSSASACSVPSVEKARVSSKGKESVNTTLIARRRARIKDDQQATTSSSSSQKEMKDSELKDGDEDSEETTGRRKYKSKASFSTEVSNSSLEMIENAGNFQNVRVSESLIAERELSGKATLLSKGHESANPSTLVCKRTRMKRIQKSKVSSQLEMKGMELEAEPNTGRSDGRGSDRDEALCRGYNSDEEIQDTDVEDDLRVSSVLSRTVHVSSVKRREITVVDSCGGSMDSYENVIVPERLVLKVELLEESGVDPSDLAILLKKRALVSVPFEKLKSVMNLLINFFGSGGMACKVLAQNSGILSKPLEHLEFKLKCLEEFELEEETCQRIGTAKHTILTMAGEALHQKLSYLRSIDLSSSSINVLLSRFPQVLRLTVSASIEPTLVYLESKGMAREDINTLILKHPSVLAMSVCNNLDKKFELLGQLGLSNEECHKAIGFLTLPSCERARSVLETLKSYGISDVNISEMVRKNPDIFSRSPENISKKIDWLINEGNREIKEIVHYPTCLCFHLDNRIVPRINALKETKFRLCPLSTVLSIPDESFRAQFHLPDFPSSKKSRQPRRQ